MRLAIMDIDRMEQDEAPRPSESVAANVPAILEPTFCGERPAWSVARFQASVIDLVDR